MQPDFTKTIKETLAKRAGYLCSNPDCRIATVGPSTKSDKATTIGEAAHIQAARPGQARYDPEMSDVARAEISNAIWLCCNCHELVDRDEQRYPAALLFQWRQSHEDYVIERLGTAGDAARAVLEHSEADRFLAYPPIVRRLVIDRPTGWEYRLTAELMRALNEPIFRRLSDLNDGLSSRRMEHLERDAAIKWVKDLTYEMGEMIEPLSRIIDRLNLAWGQPGEAGDVDDIHNCCLRLRDSLALIVDHEERLRFTRVPEEFGVLISLFQGAIGSQIEQFRAMPDTLDGIVAQFLEHIESGLTEPMVISHQVTFALPDGWGDKVTREFDRLASKYEVQADKKHASGSGCLNATIVAITIFIAVILLLG